MTQLDLSLSSAEQAESNGEHASITQKCKVNPIILFIIPHLNIFVIKGDKNSKHFTIFYKNFLF